MAPVKFNMTTSTKIVFFLIMITEIVCFIWLNKQYMDYIEKFDLHHQHQSTGQSQIYIALHNFVLYIIVIGIQLITVQFKDVLIRVFRPYIALEKNVLNIILYICMVKIVYHHSIFSNKILFELPNFFKNFLMIGDIIFIMCLFDPSKYIVFPFSFSQILKQKQLEFQQFPLQKIRGLVPRRKLQQLCKYPFSLCLIIFNSFCASRVTIDFLIFSLINNMLVLAGMISEQRNLKLIYADYKEYDTLVPNYLIPNILKLITTQGKQQKEQQQKSN